MSENLTSTDLIATASDVLTRGGYQRIADRFPEWDTTSSRLFEDSYNVVGLVVFDTCDELLRTWADVQGRLVDVISRNVGQGEAKSWDGYLILLTPGLSPSEETSVEDVRYNTTRLRKIIGTGEDIRSMADVERVLRPLLPLGSDAAKLARATVLDLLPKLLAISGIPESTTKSLVDAFREQAPLLESLHKLRSDQ
ncbi:MAG: hypothetical protein HOP29_16310 [Phycisphaerales bacterium]|nr:hypothetical protein [Phycisphaerales bacterium]